MNNRRQSLLDLDYAYSSNAMDTWELQIVTNAECLVSSADVQAARARARSLTAKNALESTNSANHNKTVSWEAESRRLESIREPLRGNSRASYHESIHSGRRTSSPTSNGIQLMKGHHRTNNTPRPTYRRNLHAANCDLMSFREKFEQWKSTYDREISKTKASLASMTPTLHGLGLAARIHKIAGKAAESLNSTPSKSQTPQTSSTVVSTPRADTLCENCIMEPSLQHLQLDTDLLSTTDEYPDFLDDDLPPLSERAGKLAEVEEDIGVLTTVIEKKIFATHVSNTSAVRADHVDVGQEAIDLCGWSEGAPTARTINMAEDDDSDLLPPPPADHDQEESDTVVGGERAKDSPSQATISSNVPKNLGPPRSVRKVNLGIDQDPPKPVNLRDNLIILAKQKGFTHVGTPHNEECVATTLPTERERAMALLRKMYAPSSPSPTAALPSPGIIDKRIPADVATSEEGFVPTFARLGGETNRHVMASEHMAGEHQNNRYLGEQVDFTLENNHVNVSNQTTVLDHVCNQPTLANIGALVGDHMYAYDHSETPRDISGRRLPRMAVH